MESGLLYFPLSIKTHQIRLVQLYAGNFDDEIQCGLVQAPLDHIESYDALSYTWGDGIRDSYILLKGRRFPVTKNLETALRHLRNGYSRLIWIDAICINQEDIQERNEQVRRMREIYAGAKMVFVWLGPASHASDIAMDFMNDRWEQGAQNDESLVREGAFREQFEAIAEGIFAKLWWERIWICQEIAVARSVAVVCGSKSIPWMGIMIFYYFMDDFKRAELAHIFGRIGRNKAPMTNMAPALNWLRNEYQAESRMPLQQLLLEFRNFRATLACDKIYALLGLATDGEKFPNPDYHKSTSEVYRETTRFIIESSKQLNFIVAASGRKSCENLPSWTPDFNIRSADNIGSPLKGLGKLLEPGIYSASKSALLSVTFDDNSLSIRADGLRLDHVQLLAPHLPRAMSFEDYWEALPQMFETWYDMAYSHEGIGDSYRTGENTRLAFSKTVTADRIGRPGENWRRFPLGSGFFDQPKEPPDDFMANLPGRERVMKWQDERAGLFEDSFNYRQFLVSKSGYIGLVPDMADVGDLICVLFGCDTPLVLRRQDDYYTLVGECYIHGIMDGELVEYMKQGLVAKEEFLLR